MSKTKTKPAKAAPLAAETVVAEPPATCPHCRAVDPPHTETKRTPRDMPGQVHHDGQPYNVVVYVSCKCQCGGNFQRRIFIHRPTEKPKRPADATPWWEQGPPVPHWRDLQPKIKATPM